MSDADKADEAEADALSREPLPRAKPGEYVLVELELERDKIALERERLSHEREKLSLERLKLKTESDLYQRQKRYIVTPMLAAAIAVCFLLVGVGFAVMFSRRGRIEVDTRKLDAPIILKSAVDGTEREATAYLIFTK